MQTKRHRFAIKLSETIVWLEMQGVPSKKRKRGPIIIFLFKCGPN